MIRTVQIKDAGQIRDLCHQAFALFTKRTKLEIF